MKNLLKIFIKKKQIILLKWALIVIYTWLLFLRTCIIICLFRRIAITALWFNNLSWIACTTLLFKNIYRKNICKERERERKKKKKFQIKNLINITYIPGHLKLKNSELYPVGQESPGLIIGEMSRINSLFQLIIID